MLRLIGIQKAYSGKYIMLTTQYAKEIGRFITGLLSVDTELPGHFKQDTKPVDLKSVIRGIDAAQDEEEARLIRIAEAGAKGWH